MLRHPPHVEQEVIRLYLEGMTGDQVAVASGVGNGSVFNILKRNGVSSRPMHVARRRYSADHSFFDQIITEEQAYVLGLWATDGCVLDNGVIALALAEKDRRFVEAVRDAMGSTHRVSIDKAHPRIDGTPRRMAKLTIASRQLAAGLLAQGIGPRKTFTVRPWPGPERLLHHYWRGAVDGDGTWGITEKRAGTLFVIGFCGNRFMADGFRDFIAARLGHVGRIKEHGSIFSLKYTGRELPQSIGRLLYQDATLYLPRKKAIADRCLAFPIKRPNRLGRVLTFNGESLRMFEWADRLGIDAELIRNRLRYGYSVERALTEPVAIGKLFITIDGETRSVAEWSRLTGLNRTTIEARHHKGKTGRDIIAPVS